MNKKTQLAILNIFCFLTIVINLAFATNNVLPETISIFKYNSNCYMLIENENKKVWSSINEYIYKYKSKFDIHNFNKWKDKINKGSNFLVVVVKNDLFEDLDGYEKDYRDALNEKYDEIIKRLEAGENFYYFDKGVVNKLIICTQDEKTALNYMEMFFSDAFKADSQDSDSDGLPEYIEDELGSDKSNKDTDGDGLTDFDEYCKYKTHLLKKDSDGDGIPDGDWNERREFTYTIRAMREIEPPYKKEVLNDFFQDVKIIEEKDGKLKYEVILYPEAVNMVIPTTEKKIKNDKEAKIYLEPTFYCNYSSSMSKELKSISKEWDLNDNYNTLKRLGDYSSYINRGYPSEPLHLYVEVNNGKINYIYNECREKLKNQFFSKDETIFDHFAFGEGMYRNRSRGSCSSTAVYSVSVLRAAGYPARIIAL
ncbi:hypothetical protein KKB18_07060, partial [bacterium]|nr:hypothetical protein [bacterium]